MSMTTIDPEQYKALNRFFEDQKKQLFQTARQVDGEGAWARGMLVFIPALLHHVKKERSVQIPADDVFNGLANVIADLALHTIRITQSPAERPGAFNLLMRQLERNVRDRVNMSDGGLLLPGQGVRFDH